MNRVITAVLLLMNKGRSKAFQSAFLLVSLLALSSFSFAEGCIVNSPVSVDFNAGYTVKSTDPVGTVLAKKDATWTITCDDPELYRIYWYFYGSGTVVIGDTYYLKTSDPGIGIKMTVVPTNYGLDASNGSLRGATNGYVELANVAPTGVGRGNVIGTGFQKTPMLFTVNMELTVIGPVAGTVTLAPIAVSPRGSRFQLGSYDIAGGQIPPIVVRLNTPTCAVDDASKAQNVSLQDVGSMTLTGIGKTSEPTAFFINLTCSGGTSDAKAVAQIGFTDANDTGNTSTTLSLSPASTAKGVGLQLSTPAGQLFTLAPDSTAWDAAGHKTVGEWVNGKYTLMLLASYIQTETKVTPGSVQSMALFTMSYK